MAYRHAVSRSRLVGLGPALLVLLGAAAAFLPLLWFVFSAFKTRADILAVPVHLLPRKWTVKGFADLLSQTQLGRAYINSVILALMTLASVLFTSSLGGFVFARLRFPGRQAVFALVLGTTMVPFLTLLIPLYLVVAKMGLVDTYVGVWLPTAVSSFGIFLCRQYITTIPKDFYEAAKLDGANDFQIYWRIVVPLIRPVLAVLAVFNFLASFNNYLWPLVVLDDQKLYPLPLELAQMSQTLGITNYETVIAGALLTAVPGVVIFIALQRHILQGLNIGGVKG